ncbi:MAG: hypothetical protein A2096_03470 [Spirochaetes bacterium GWF1_41_5]|nr:MAG: hypothetical protein A2096_03470 [Spirochaetes bacterium GWF1_41_5]
MKNSAVVLICLAVLLMKLFPETIKLGVYDNHPLVFTDQGKTQGFFIDLLEYIAEREKWNLEYYNLPFSECMSRLSAGKIDMVADVARTPERLTLYDFNHEIVFVSWGKIYANKKIRIDKFTDLAGKKIAVVKDEIYFNHPGGIKDILENFQINCRFIEVQDSLSVFVMIHTGQADAGVVNRLYGELNNFDYDNVKETYILFKPTHLLYAFKKNSPINRRIIPAMDRHLRELKRREKSFFYKSLDTYFMNANIIKIKQIPEWIYKALAVGLPAFLFITLLIYSLVLKRQVNLKTIALARANEELLRLANLDAMTGLNNHRCFMNLLETELERCLRYGKEFSFLMLDIDFFKKINDTWGHQTGDRVLERFGAIIKSALRKSDLAGRYGGEEFTILLPETQSKGALQAALNICRLLQKENFTAPSGEIFRVSVSIGIYSGSGREKMVSAEIIHQADTCLYYAKKNGRNAVVYRKKTGNYNKFIMRRNGRTAA